MTDISLHCLACSVCIAQYTSIDLNHYGLVLNFVRSNLSVNKHLQMPTRPGVLTIYQKNAEVFG